MGTVALKRLRMGGKEYFIDERLNEIRNVKDPFDAESMSPELISFWNKNCEQQGDFMVCDMRKPIRRYGWEELESIGAHREHTTIKGNLIDTGRTVRPERTGIRHIFKDDTGQEWIKIRGMWWRFPEQIEY